MRRRRRWSGLGAIGLTVATVTSCAGSTPPTSTVSTELPSTPARTVSRIVDGDTIVIDGGEKVRFIGVDTPETKDPRKPVQCFGEAASAFTSSLIPPDTKIRLEYDISRTDRYGRTLAYVYRDADGLFVNAELVRQGYAVSATYPPDVAHADELAALAAGARDAGLGLWGACGDAVTPPTTTASAPVQAFVGGEHTGACDPAYPTACIPSAPPDLDCRDVAASRFEVRAPDPHGFDRDRDGIGCES